MPCYYCQHPTCSALVKERGGFCAAHEHLRPFVQGQRHQLYDRDQRDRSAKTFYDSKAWRHTRGRKLAQDPVCERCRRVWASDVHHKVAVADSAELRLAIDNLVSLCGACHKRVEAQRKMEAQQKGVEA